MGDEESDIQQFAGDLMAKFLNMVRNIFIYKIGKD